MPSSFFAGVWELPGVARIARMGMQYHSLQLLKSDATYPLSIAVEAVFSN